MGLIAVGDIHGCSRTLKALLEALSPGAEDHLVFLGDYVDRGPDTRGVIHQLIELSKQVRCTFLRGNHEQAMLDWLSGKRETYWLHFGGEETRQSYMQRGKMDVPTTHLSFLQSTTLYLETPEFFFVHAGLRPDRTVRENIHHAEAEVFLHYREHLRVAVPVQRQNFLQLTTKLFTVAGFLEFHGEKLFSLRRSSELRSLNEA